MFLIISKKSISFHLLNYKIVIKKEMNQSLHCMLVEDSCLSQKEQKNSSTLIECWYQGVSDQ